MNKKILSLFSAIAMLLSAVIPVAAKTGAEPAVTNLILNSGGSLRDGVELLTGYEGVASDYTGEMTDVGKLENIADGDDSTFWFSQHKYDRPYVIVDLGRAYTLTGIRYLPFDGYTDDYTDEEGVLQKPGNYWRNLTEIQISNNADFTSYKTVYTIGYEGLEDNASISLELEENINQYRYIRIYRTTADAYTNPIGIREIAVTGYEEFLPQDMLHDADGNIRSGVSASSPNGGYSAYSNVNYAIDNLYSDSDGTHGGRTTTYISNFGEKEPYVQVDLGAVRGISAVRILPFRGNNISDTADWYYRSGLKIYASNNPSFEGGGMLLYDGGAYSSTNYAPRDTWLETDMEEIMLFRYIRVVAGGDVIGMTEISAEGYEIFEDIAVSAETAPEIYFVTDGENITAKAVNGGNNTLIIAAYEADGKMAAVKTAQGAASLPINADYTYKAFLWNNLDSMRPEADKAEYNK